MYKYPNVLWVGVGVGDRSMGKMWVHKIFVTLMIIINSNIQEKVLYLDGNKPYLQSRSRSLLNSATLHLGVGDGGQWNVSPQEVCDINKSQYTKESPIWVEKLWFWALFYKTGLEACRIRQPCMSNFKSRRCTPKRTSIFKQLYRS